MPDIDLSGIEKLITSENMSFEIDYMAIPNEKDILKWIDVGVSKLIIHAKSTQSTTELVDLLHFIQKNNVEAHLAFIVSDDVSKYTNSINICDGVQCMGIETVGMQGQPFTTKVFDLIASIKQIRPDVFLSVDGAVNEHNALELINAGVGELVVGSALGLGDLDTNVKKFANILVG